MQFEVDYMKQQGQVTKNHVLTKFQTLYKYMQLLVLVDVLHQRVKERKEKDQWLSKTIKRPINPGIELGSTRLECRCKQEQLIRNLASREKDTRYFNLISNWLGKMHFLSPNKYVTYTGSLLNCKLFRCQLLVQSQCTGRRGFHLIFFPA